MKTIDSLKAELEEAEVLSGRVEAGLREAIDRLMVAEGDARYENGNIELAKRLGELIGYDPTR